MDKAEYQSRLEELNSLVKKEDYEGALAVVEAVDWRRVKSLRTLGGEQTISGGEEDSADGV